MRGFLKPKGRLLLWRCCELSRPGALAWPLILSVALVWAGVGGECAGAEIAELCGRLPACGMASKGQLPAWKLRASEKFDRRALQSLAEEAAPVLWFTAEELTALGNALGRAVRQIRAHI